MEKRHTGPNLEQSQDLMEKERMKLEKTQDRG